MTLSRQLEAEAEEAARIPPWPASLGIAKELALQAVLEAEVEANMKRGLETLLDSEDEREPEPEPEPGKFTGVPLLVVSEWRVALF